MNALCMRAQHHANRFSYFPSQQHKFGRRFSWKIIIMITDYLESTCFASLNSHSTLHAYVGHSTFLKEKSPIGSLSSHGNVAAIAAYDCYHVHLPFSLCISIFWKTFAMRHDSVLHCARTQRHDSKPRGPYAGALQAEKYFFDLS